jgi:hypothetical protein
MILFLLLSGYAAHYVHCGIAKLRFGGHYYILRNNPFFLSMNAYKSGWLRGISEETVARIGRYADRIKPVLNATILLIEVGASLILFSYPVAMAIGCLTFGLHLTIFSISGDNFWQWMSINAALIIGLITAGESVAVLFADTEWFLVSLLFITFAAMWMKPEKLGWLDSPYYESYRIEAEYDDRPAQQVNTVVFQPLESIIRQGFSGHFTYLGTNPRTTENWGDISDIETHKYLHDIYPESPDTDEAKYLVEGLGTDMHDPRRTDEFRERLERFVTKRGFRDHSVLKYLTPPREQYHYGFPGISSRGVPQTEPERLQVYRIDGIWTDEGFQTLSRSELFSVSIPE